MRVHQLYEKYWNWAGDHDSLVHWIEGLLVKEPNNLDYNYLYLDVLAFIGYDNRSKQLEPGVNNLCSAVIRDKNSDALQLAKAYTYRGEIKYLGIDRRKDFDKALQVMDKLDINGDEVKFLWDIIEAGYHHEFRQYLWLDRGYFQL